MLQFLNQKMCQINLIWPRTSGLILQFFKCNETTKINPSMYVLLCIPVPRRSHRRCSVKKDVLKNLENFTWKHLCWSLFLIKLQAWRPVTLLKRSATSLKKTPTHMFSYKIFENFKNTYFKNKSIVCIRKTDVRR